MKIAVVTDDGSTISQHFGQATRYAVVDISEGKINFRELRDKPGHQTFSQSGQPHQHEHGPGHGMDAHSQDKHNQMIAVIQDCQVLLARGMGRGAHISLSQAGIRPLQVDFDLIDDALQALIDGRIDEHIREQLCGDHDHRH